jgi:hypothetical protein
MEEEAAARLFGASAPGAGQQPASITSLASSLPSLPKERDGEDGPCTGLQPLLAASMHGNGNLEYDVHRRDDWLHIKTSNQNKTIAALKANQRQTGTPSLHAFVHIPIPLPQEKKSTLLGPLPCSIHPRNPTPYPRFGFEKGMPNMGNSFAVGT